MLTCLCIEILYRFQNVWMFVDSEFTSFVKGSNVNRYLAKILLAAVQWCYFCSDFCLQSPPMYWVETDETITELQPDSRPFSSYHWRFCTQTLCCKHRHDKSDHFCPVWPDFECNDNESRQQDCPWLPRLMRIYGAAACLGWGSE